MANKDTSKQWFETGDYPTQAQFAQVFDWLRWKDEGIAITDVTNLQSILNAIVGETYTGVAGEALGGGKLVYLSAGKFYLYDANNVALADAAFGITIGAAITDAPCYVQMNGVFTETGLGLTPDVEYYAGLNGLLTDTPTYAVCTLVGIALTADKLKIEIQQSIITA